MTYQIFKYVSTGLFGGKRSLFELEGINNSKTIIVGTKKLIRLYREGRIKGHLPDHIKFKLGLERRKERSDKGIKKKNIFINLQNGSTLEFTGVVEKEPIKSVITNHWLELKEWNLPDVWYPD